MDYDYLARRDMRVFVVEDSAPVRERLVELLREVSDVEVVGEAGNFPSAVSGILETLPDVAILDIKLADDTGSGIDVLCQVRKALPGLRAIVLSNHVSPQHLKASADAGAEFFLDKSSDFERIPEVLGRMRGRGSVR